MKKVKDREPWGWEKYIESGPAWPRGRTCTGQAIILDGVVNAIYYEMMEGRG